MAKPKKHDCVPAVPGYYWASDRHGNRLIVLIGPDGFDHMRAYTCRNSSSRNPSDFTDYKGPIKE